MIILYCYISVSAIANYYRVNGGDICLHVYNTFLILIWKLSYFQEIKILLIKMY